MVWVIPVRESNGEVLSPLAGRPGEFYRTKPVYVRVVSVATDETDPIEVREGLVGLRVRTIFDRNRLCELGNFGDSVCVGDRVAYAEDVCDSLRRAGLNDAVLKLMKAAEGDPLAFYIIKASDCELALV